jgi:hypothetical protein
MLNKDCFLSTKAAYSVIFKTILFGKPFILLLKTILTFGLFGTTPNGREGVADKLSDDSSART